MGWEDADFDDGDTFRSIMGFIRENGFTHIKAVVWCVIPNVRKDAAIVRQVSGEQKEQMKKKPLWTWGYFW